LAAVRPWTLSATAKERTKQANQRDRQTRFAPPAAWSRRNTDQQRRWLGCGHVGGGRRQRLKRQLDRPASQRHPSSDRMCSVPVARTHDTFHRIANTTTISFAARWGVKLYSLRRPLIAQHVNAAVTGSEMTSTCVRRQR